MIQSHGSHDMAMAPASSEDPHASSAADIPWPRSWPSAVEQLTPQNHPKPVKPAMVQKDTRLMLEGSLLLQKCLAHHS